MGYWMYAWVHGVKTDKNITVTSIANYQKEINEQTTAGNSALNSLAAAFKAGRRPSPFIFTWKPDAKLPGTLFTPLFTGGVFTVELRIVERDTKASFRFNFYDCKLIRPQPQSTRNGQIKIEATYTSFN